MKRLILSAIFLSAQPTLLVAQTTDPTAAQGAPSTSSTAPDWEALKARYVSEEAAWKAMAARIQAEETVLKAKIGTVTGTSLGALTPGTDPAKAEALLLVTRAAIPAAAKMRTALDSALLAEPKRPIMVVGAISSMSVSDALLFDMQVANLNASFESASRGFELAEQASADLGRVGRGGDNRMAFLTGVGLGLDAVSKIGSYFNSDYTFGKVEVTPPDGMILAAAADALRGSGHTIYNPTLIAPMSAADVLAILTGLQVRYVVASGQVAVANSAAASLADAKDPKSKKAAARYLSAEGALNRAIAAYDTFSTSLASAGSSGEPLIARVLRQRSVQSSMSQAVRPLMLLVADKQAAAYYTKKNLWTFLGGPPLYTMGGIALAYALVDPATGEIKASGTISQHGGYRSVRAVEKMFQGQ